MKMSRYVLQDLITVEIARRYSNTFEEPFFVAVGNHPDFDIVSKSGRVKIEVKMETTPLRTGKVCIEYHNDDLNQPSGILRTKANKWVHVVLEEEGFIAYEYDISVLRRLVIENGETKNNGHNSRFRLIPLPLFRQSATRAFKLETAYGDQVIASSQRAEVAA